MSKAPLTIVKIVTVDPTPRPSEMVALSNAMQKAWIAFAYSGEPGHAGLPHWPRFGAEHTATMTLGAEMGVDRGRSEQERELWEALFHSP